MKNREKEIYKVTLLGSAVNAILVLIKLIAGIIGQSSALLADAVHSLTDFVTDIIVVIFVRISAKPCDEEHGYGHGKFETFATMIIGIILLGTGIGLFANSIRLIISRFSGAQLPEPGWIALTVALLSIIAKEALYRYTVAKGRNLRSDAVAANAWHHRSDAISSVGTAIGIAGAMFLGSKWRILDPMAAAVVSLFIMKAGYDIVRPAMNELLDGSLPKEQIATLRQIIGSVSGVDSFHRLRSRKIGNGIAVDVHIKMDGGITLFKAHDIATQVENEIRKSFGNETTIYVHMEPSSVNNARLTESPPA